ncbi:MAG: serpin family protein, partial [Ignavibacteriae bacterium]|nr:serpin family protein [Ignavibacteriota bacterium]
LGMTLNGANGSTYDAMQSTLELSSLSNQEINEAYKSLIELLTQIDPKVQFDIANSIWYKNDLSFEQDFIDVNKKYFNAEVEGLNFNDPNSVKIINNWVSANTNGKIKSILNEIPSDAIMYLINAIYFKGTWKYEFDKDNTLDNFFKLSNGNEVPCKMMIQENDFEYYSGRDFQAIDLPYGDGHFSMTVILPNENKTVDEIIKNLDKESWDSWINNFNELKGTLQLPKFKLENEYSLNDVLKALGMEIAFNSGAADFTNLYEPGGVFISNVKHKTYVDVNEEGTEAAAVTSVEISYTSVGDGGFNMRIDKPFFCN